VVLLLLGLLKMKLITEQINDVEFLTEEKNGKKYHYIQGVFMQTEKPNRNGRVYPKHLVEREVGLYEKNYISQNRAFGELGHPDSPQINLDRVSHMIKSLRPDGNNFVGKAQIMDTPNGKIVQSFLEAGAKLGVSCRGVGSLRPHKGYQLVQDDYHLATAADIVADPSAQDAFVSGIMEGKEWLYVKGKWEEKDYDQAKAQLMEASRHDYETRALGLLENFLSKL
jgi:hypothetical protein